MMHTILLSKFFSTYSLVPFKNLDSKNSSGTYKKKGTEGLTTTVLVILFLLGEVTEGSSNSQRMEPESQPPL